MCFPKMIAWPTYCVCALVGIIAISSGSLLWAVPLPPGLDGTHIELRFTKGKAIYVVIACDQETIAKVAGQEQKHARKGTFTVRLLPVEQEKSGAWIVNLKVLAAEGDVGLGGGTPMKSGEWVGSEFRLHINKDLVVDKVDGTSELGKKIPGMDMFGPEFMSAMVEDGVKELIEPLLAPAAPKAVRDGDTWKRTTRRTFGPFGNYETATEFTYNGAADDAERLTSKSVWTYQPPKGDAALKNIPLKITGATMTTKDSSGVHLFDRKLGRIVSSETKITLEATMNLDAGGNITTADMVLRQNTKVRTYERNPLDK